METVAKAVQHVYTGHSEDVNDTDEQRHLTFSSPEYVHFLSVVFHHIYSRAS